MPSHPSSLPGPLVVLAAPLLVLPLLLSLELVAPLATLICAYVLIDSSIVAGPCGSWWDLGRLAIWVYLRRCTYMRTWTCCNW